MLLTVSRPAIFFALAFAARPDEGVGPPLEKQRPLTASETANMLPVDSGLLDIKESLAERENKMRYDPASFLQHVEMKSISIPMDGFPPGKNIERFGRDSVQHAGSGSFGDVWRVGQNTSAVLKIFYIREEYITKQDAAAEEGDSEAVLKEKRRLQRKIDKAQEECRRTHVDIVQNAKDRGLETSHICDCLEEHISDASATDPLFLVLEDCGMGIDMAMQKHLDNIDEVRSVMRQLLDGIQTVSELKLVHHDLKPANVAYDVHTGRVKLIDFGALLNFPADEEKGSAYTPGYQPPEFAARANFDVNAPASAFDCYSAGIIYLQLLCRLHRKYLQVATALHKCPEPEKQVKVRSGQGTKGDFKIIAGLLQSSAAERWTPKKAIAELDAIENSFSIGHRNMLSSLLIAASAASLFF